MRLGVFIPPESRLPAGRLVELAAAAERGGFDTALVGEVNGSEAMALLGAVAASTDRIRIGSGVVPMATRSPALLAMGFATLASLAPGRVVAGVGVSSPGVVEGWHGRTFESPLPFARRFLQELRQALDGKQLEGGFRLALELEQRVPIMLGAMRPRMIELAGELADVLFLAWCTPEETRERAALARRAAERAGRDPDSLLIFVAFFAYAGSEPDDAVDRIRRYIVRYAGVPTHRDSVRGIVPQLDEIERLWARGEHARALELIDDDAVHRLAVVGGGKEIVRRAEEFRAAGAHLPLVIAFTARPGDDDAGPFETIECLTEADPFDNRGS